MEREKSLAERYLEKVKEKQLQEAQGGYWGDSNYFIKSLKKLVGYQVIQVIVSDESRNPYLGLRLQKGLDRRDIWFLQDEEDNGPGFFDINPMFEDEELEGI